MLHKELPLSWNNVSLQEYIDLQTLLLNEEQREDEDLIMGEIQLLYGKNPYAMPLPEFHQCINGLSFLSKEMPKMKVKDQYNLNGNVYFLHKSLSDFKVGQYMDYERIIKEKKGLDMYAEFIALFLTPSQSDSYGDGYDVPTVVNDILNYMSIADACSITAFFLRLSKAYIIRFLWSSIRRTTRTMKDRKTKRELKKKTRQMIKMIAVGE